MADQEYDGIRPEPGRPVISVEDYMVGISDAAQEAYARGRRDAAAAVREGEWTRLVDQRIVDMAAQAAEYDKPGWRSDGV